MKRQLIAWICICVSGFALPAMGQQKPAAGPGVTIPSTIGNVVRGMQYA